MAGTSLKTEEYPLVSKTQNYLFQIFLMVFDRFKPTWITIQERIHYTHIATFDHPTVKSISMTSIEFKWPIRCHSDQTGPSGNMYRGQYGLMWYPHNHRGHLGQPWGHMKSNVVKRFQMTNLWSPNDRQPDHSAVHGYLKRIHGHLLEGMRPKNCHCWVGPSSIICVYSSLINYFVIKLIGTWNVQG